MTAGQNLLSILLALGIPALIAIAMPRRWRVAALILWVLSPVIVLLVLGGIEAARNPAEADLGKLLYGLALIGSILALPWLLACLIGFALGSVLRKKPATPAAAPVVAVVTASPVAARPPSRPGTTRRAYGVAFLILAGALLTIAGATVMTLHFSPDPPPQELDRIPAMPRTLRP
ncbi:hypothetical protein [Plastoroseomonas hellenica]|uniref:hypothetical protein n=1 Tax=Plastoroseomonas hellenica TaxID=2687306 RepID=UPI001BA61580|nr:hypothetical protein [Plastoroseomonas hellenica]MBR0644945.1 hypothetical protein [Plastoroseomonas hellenica]